MREWSKEQETPWGYKCNIEVRSYEHFCRRKAVNIKYSECVSVALITQHAKRMRRIIVIFGLPGSSIFIHIIS
jgi:hypothetical protein